MSPLGDIGKSDILNLQKKVWSRAEEVYSNWTADLRSKIHANKQTKWKDHSTALDTADAVEGTEKEEPLIEGAVKEINRGLNRLLGVIIRAADDPEESSEEVSEELVNVMMTLHNPEVQEALLLAVKPEYRDDIREWFDELGNLYWGMGDMMADRKTDEYWAMIDVLATAEGKTVEEIAEREDGVDVSEVPDEYLD